MKRLAVLLGLFCIASFSKGQQTFYDPEDIQLIEIFFAQPNWDYMLDTAKMGADSYIIAQKVRINGTEFPNPGVKYKGNSSYDSTYRKNPLHIELDHVQNQSYQGIKDIKLSNCYADPSMIREALAYQILNNYMISPRANFAKVYINGRYMGVYTNTESIGKSFCNNNFGISNQTFFKCNPINLPSPLTKSNLRYLSADSTAYFPMYELKSDKGWNELVSLCNVLTNQPSQVAELMDMDRAAWMLAFNNVLVNLDSYSGVFAQNHYIYKDASGRFSPIVWDLNMAFGGFPFAGSGASSMGALSVSQMQQMPPTLHATDTYWPLIRTMMNNDSLRRIYYAHMRTIVKDFFLNSAYLTLAQDWQNTVAEAALADTNKFFTNEQFLNGLTQDYPIANYTVPGLANLMQARVNYLNAHTEFALQAPLITSVGPANPNPQLYQQITFRATVSGAGKVFLAYRRQSFGQFQALELFDDGLHDDGAAGDGVYANQLQLTTSVTWYYIHANNALATALYPERAQHVLLSVTASSPPVMPGQLAINEFLAKNDNGVTNEYGEKADWIELINNTSETLVLSGLFMTDNPNNLQKWAFPANATIPGGGLLIVWADERPDTPGNIHCNFKLSADGEHIYISRQDGTLIDYISFGPQAGDVSTGRCPDGTGTYITFNPPSFNTRNCPVGLDEKTEIDDYNPFSLYPNPTSGVVTLTNASGQYTQALLSDNTGRTLASFHFISSKVLNVSFLKPGVYVLRLRDTSGCARAVKLVIQR